MIRKCLITLVSVVFFIDNGYAQTASATWALTSNTAVVVMGNVTAKGQVLTDSMSVRDYNGGVVGRAARIWRSNLYWPNDSMQNNDRYIQYSISPVSGYNFAVHSISLDAGCFGTNDHIYANFYCSTDSTFATSLKLNSTALKLPDIRSFQFAALSYSPGIIINDGQTFYFRIYPWYDYTPSTSKYVCLRNVIIDGFAELPGDSISTSLSSLSGFQHYVGSPSLTQSYSVSGYNLTDNITITPPEGFEISTDNGTTWCNQSSSIVLLQTAGAIAGQPIAITARMNALVGGARNGEITHASANAIWKYVSVDGYAMDSINISTVSINDFLQSLGSPSTYQTYTVSGEGLFDNITIVPPNGYEVSIDSGSTWHRNSSPLVLFQNEGKIPGQPITVRVRLNDILMGIHNGNISHTSAGAVTRNIALNGITIDTEPTTQSILTFDNVTSSSIVVHFSGGGGSRRVLVIHSGSEVSWAPTDAHIIDGVNSHFFIATDQGGGNKVVYDGNELSATVTGLLGDTTYYFACYEYNMEPDYSQNYLTISPGRGHQTTLFAPSVLTATQSSFSFGNVMVHDVSSAQSYILSGLNLNPANGTISITAPEGFQVSTQSDKGFVSSMTIPYSAGGFAPMPLYLKFFPEVLQSYSDSLLMTGGGTSRYITVNGTGSNTVVGGDYFVAPWGSDTSSGTLDHPFATIGKALQSMSAGDTIYVRDSIYSLNSTIVLSGSGISNGRNCLFAYPGEHPTLDFSSMPLSGSNRGIYLSGSYWHIKGFDVCKAGDNGMYITGSNNIVEFCSFYENNDSGLQLDGGASNNQVVNCDSYYNYDVGTSGANADGFAPKLGTGTQNSFYGCRSWQNSDDGWDGYQAIASTTIENCWAFMNGFRKDGSDAGLMANGNGFKTGGNYTIHDNVLKNCLSFQNKSKGFDQNHNRGSISFLNCTSYDNGQIDSKPNFSVSEQLYTGKTLTVKNCIALGSTGVDLRCPDLLTATNSWPDTSTYPTTFSVARDTDFVTLDTAGVRGHRKPDGSLPDIAFMHLATGSDLIDAGTNVGLPYIGLAPDLGCFESNIVTSVGEKPMVSLPKSYQLFQNYPNPFNPSTDIRYNVASASVVKLSVYNILGQEVAILLNAQRQPGSYTVRWNAARQSSGIYFARLWIQTIAGKIFTQTQKMLFAK